MIDPLHNELSPESIGARDLKNLMHPATNLADMHSRGPSIRTRAKGVYIWDEQGNRYLEGMAGLWCTALGYGITELAEVAKEQMEKLSFSHLFAGTTNEPSVLLAEKLVSMVPIENGRVFFGLSGSDANDTQIKLMWLYHNLIGKPEKKKIIARLGAYHGLTIGAGSLTGLPQFHQNFDLPIPGILHTSNPNYYRFGQPGESEEQFASRLADDLEQMILAEGPETVAAFVAEPVIGAGGVIVPPTGYYPKIQAVLSKYDVLFVDDEVICGFGRTGNAFGCETVDIDPTTMSIAKALSSAYLPISGVIVPDSVYEPIREATHASGLFGHGFTYSGHPVSAAVALRNLELMDECDLFNEVKRKSPLFLERARTFEASPLVGNVRGVGLMAGIELVQNTQTKEVFPRESGVGIHCMNRCKEHGLIARAIGDVMCFCPPLVISDDQIDEMFNKFELALDDTIAAFA